MMTEETFHIKPDIDLDYISHKIFRKTYLKKLLHILIPNSTLNNSDHNQIKNDIIETTPNFEYNRDTLQFTLGIIISLIGSLIALQLIQNLRYLNNKKDMILVLFLSNLSYSIIALWIPNIIFIHSIKFKEIEIFLDKRLTIFCLLSGILCCICGSSISFLPYLEKTFDEYKKKIIFKRLSFFYSNNKSFQRNKKSVITKKKLSKITNNEKIDNQSSNLNNNLTIKYKYSPNNSNLNNSNINNDLSNSKISLNHKNTRQNNENNNLSDFKNLHNISNNRNIEHKITKSKNIIYNLSNLDVNTIKINNNNNLGETLKVNETKNLNTFNLPNLKFSYKEDFNFSDFLSKNNITIKEIIYFVIGGFILGMSALIINYLEICSIKINGEIKFDIKAQIIISLLSLIGGYFLHFGFLNKNKILIKAILPVGITLINTLIHYLSIKYLSFSKFENPDLDLNYKNLNLISNNLNGDNNPFQIISERKIPYFYKYILSDTSGFTNSENLFKILLSLMMIIPYAILDICNEKYLISNKIIIFINDYTKIGNKEKDIIFNFCELLKPKENLDKGYENEEYIENKNIEEINNEFNTNHSKNKNNKNENNLPDRIDHKKKYNYSQDNNNHIENSNLPKSRRKEINTNNISSKL